MRRREFIKTSATALAGAVLGGKIISAAEKRPNILLILVDQLRQPRWTPAGVTPNLDRLAQTGVSFTQHFVSAVPCSPSRACMITGTYTTQNHMHSNCDFQVGERQPSLDPRIPTLGHIFRDAGFRTPYRGKWHLTRKADRDPRDPLRAYGFEGWKPPEAPFGGAPYNGAVMDPVYAREAKAWLKDPNHHRQPWLLVCSLVNPHDICEWPRYYPQTRLRPVHTDTLPDNWRDDLSTKPGCQREFQERYQKLAGFMDPGDEKAWRRYLDYYLHCQRDVDENVGDVLRALEQSGQRENTIVVFTSDHGEMAGSHGLRTKGCFAYEEVMNVPLIFSWPGHLPAGAVTGAFASNVDVAPTLAGLAGITRLPYLAGRDLSPVLQDPARGSVQDEILYHQGWELEVGLSKQSRTSAFSHPAHVRCLRDREWKYAYYFSPDHDQVEHELYHLKDDPLEMTNLGNDPGYEPKRREMFARLMEREQKLIEEFEA
ncbi:MAG: hypothetical protein A2V67_12420 [Deltaproteobacteria bacterium RBG_13_61_14]|nr:MAG: hypothetical protein A2V67_12420 [Deltaproteobacteria bacterium RBG_13_61_14]